SALPGTTTGTLTAPVARWPRPSPAIWRWGRTCPPRSGWPRSTSPGPSRPASPWARASARSITAGGFPDERHFKHAEGKRFEHRLLVRVKPKHPSYMARNPMGSLEDTPMATQAPSGHLEELAGRLSREGIYTRLEEPLGKPPILHVLNPQL